MKRVNVRNGLKQRVNEILGTDYGYEGEVPGLTEWSIQALMLGNLRRIASSLNGNANGRPMKGLFLSQSGSLGIEISAGSGVTPAGDIIVLDTGIVSTVDGADGDRYIYLIHKMGEIDGDTYPDGKRTGFIGKVGTQNIVYDDFAASKKDTVQTFVDDILQVSTSFIGGNSDLIYLGKVTIDGGAITAVVETDSRGLAPNSWNGKTLFPNLDITYESEFGGLATFKNGAIFESGAPAEFEGNVSFHVASVLTTSEGPGFSGTLVVRDAAGTGTTTMKFKQGLFIGTL